MSHLKGRKLPPITGKVKVRGKLHKKKVGNVIIVERKFNIAPRTVSFLKLQNKGIFNDNSWMIFFVFFP